MLSTPGAVPVHALDTRRQMRRVLRTTDLSQTIGREGALGVKQGAALLARVDDDKTIAGS